MSKPRRNTLPPVPRQSRPRMVVKAFRVLPDVWAKFEARCKREQLNPTEVVRDLVKEWAEDEGD